MINMDDANNTLFAVIGMARSGTSAISRGLNALGIDFGSVLTPPNQKWNPKGFWEDIDIVYKINRQMMAAINYSWQPRHELIKQFHENVNVQILREEAIKLLQTKMDNKKYWGFKDPRTTQLLPFWQNIFEALQVKDHYVIALRHPLSVAQSCQRVKDTPIEIGLLLWLQHLYPAISETHGKKRIVISYEKILQQPIEQLRRIENYFQLPKMVKKGEIEHYANEFLDKKLDHFASQKVDDSNYSQLLLAPICLTIYDFLLKLANDEIEFDSDTFYNEWQYIEMEYQKLYPIYSYAFRLYKETHQLKTQMKTVYRSIPWKIIYPMRVIDDTLRQIRRAVRKKKRLVRIYG